MGMWSNPSALQIRQLINSSLLQVYVETEAWEEAFTLSQLTPELGSKVPLLTRANINLDKVKLSILTRAGTLAARCVNSVGWSHVWLDGR